VRELAKEFGITTRPAGSPRRYFPGYPWTFLVDAKGRIRRRSGERDRATSEPTLAPLLMEMPAGCPALARGTLDGVAPR
jgi:hypothetical protein